MTTGATPYETPIAADTDDTGLADLETTLTASEQTVDIFRTGGGATVHAEVFNGQIPGPTFKVDVNQTVVVRLVNDLPHEAGIHWHGIELANYSDGTEVTQDGVPGLGSGPGQVTQEIGPTGSGVVAGGTFLYKFTVTRPGLYWYHPHHHNSLNRVFRGMYGMIVVTDPLERNIVSLPGDDRALPSETDTMQLVLSDITVCGATNPDPTYPDPNSLSAADRAEWLSNKIAQNAPTPKALCEIAANGGSATNDDGTPRTAATGGDYGAGFVPSGARPSGGGIVNFCEGQTVLTNGVNVGGRLGQPDNPGNLTFDPSVITPLAPRVVKSGQGLRLQMVNCAILRYFRLRLTYRDSAGAAQQVPIYRIGGEGGLLDSPILEGGPIGTFNFNYDPGEILLAPATRADVVVAIPSGLSDGTVLTLWTRDFGRTGGNIDLLGTTPWAQIPSVPVMHLIINGSKAGTPYTITTGTALRTLAGMPLVQDLGAVVPGSLLSGTANIQMTTSGAPRIDNTPFAAGFMGSPTSSPAPHPTTARFAEESQVLQLQVTNMGRAHHPFHLHGFSFQPISMVRRVGAPADPATPPITGDLTFPYHEFRDTIDIPRHHTLTFRVRTDPRPLVDGVTAGGAFGRWLFHCHIFFHHGQGMVSELVVESPGGIEKPNIKVGGAWVHAATPGTAIRRGRFFHPNGQTVTLSASIGNLNYVPGPSGTWEWTYNAGALEAASTRYVYITATDGTRRDQAVFRLRVGGTDNGSDRGDPHIRTVDGTRYDFQAAGEFTLLRDREGMEIQVRQTPAATPPPILDGYSGLTACVSLNTAVAVRVGSHTIAFQPPPVRASAAEVPYRFHLDGKIWVLTPEGIDLDGHRVSGFDAGDELGLRVDFTNGTVLLVTPLTWTSYGIRYLDVDVSNTSGDEGLMGRIPKGAWLPSLRSGENLGPRPKALSDRYVQLYQTFADSWRLTDRTSMFVYRPGTSTATFTDVDWPAPPFRQHVEVVREGGEFPINPACQLEPGFLQPLKPIERNIPIPEAKQICKGVTIDELHDACVFDVAATGDPEFVKGYLFAQELRLHSTRVHIAGGSQTTYGQPLVVTAIVVPLHRGQSSPTGAVVFVVDGVATSPPLPIDSHGRASFTIPGLAIGEHQIRAAYWPNKPFHASTSPNLLHTVGREPCPPKPKCPPPQKPVCPPGVREFFRRHAPPCLSELTRRVRRCIDELTPCSCGGDHSEADHPGHDHGGPGGHGPAPGGSHGAGPGPGGNGGKPGGGHGGGHRSD